MHHYDAACHAMGGVIAYSWMDKNAHAPACYNGGTRMQRGRRGSAGTNAREVLTMSDSAQAATQTHTGTGNGTPYEHPEFYRPPLIYTGHTDVIWRLAVAPNGQEVASASQDATVQVWKPTHS